MSAEDRETLAALAKSVTAGLCHVITHGRPENDNLPQSADFSAAINWLKHNNISITRDDEDEANQLRERVREALAKRQQSGLPPLDMEHDDEATA